MGGDQKYFSDENAETEVNESGMIIPASGHEYGAPVYTWSEDHTSRTAVVSCTKCGHEKEKEAGQISSQVTQNQT